jgi:hypothetical protein
MSAGVAGRRRKDIVVGSFWVREILTGILVLEWLLSRKADPCLRQAGLTASRARQTAAGMKKRGTPRGMTAVGLFS